MKCQYVAPWQDALRAALLLHHPPAVCRGLVQGRAEDREVRLVLSWRVCPRFISAQEKLL